LLSERVRGRKRMGFPTPLTRWLLDARAAPVYDALRSDGGVLAEYLDRTEIERLITRHQSGLEDGTDRIWRLLNLEMWGRVFLTGAGNPCDVSITAASQSRLSSRC
jgi:asparagine synthase (glutamine-hydrolysing)